MQYGISLDIGRLPLLCFIGFYYVPIRDTYCKPFEYFFAAFEESRLF